MSDEDKAGTRMISRVLLCLVMILPLISEIPAPSPLAGPAAYTGEPKTIAHDFLDLEKDFGAGREHYEMVNRIINKAVKMIKVREGYSTEQAVQTMLAIDSLLKEEGFVFKNNLLLYRGLDKKILDCDNYCAIYTAIAEVLRIPVIPAYAPNHSFLRFNFSDGSYLNWETTDSKPRPDSYYIQTLNINKKSIEAGVYLKSLTRKEFIAVEYNNIGAYLMAARKFSAAVPYFSTAISLYPAFSSACHNRGTAYYAGKRIDSALSDLLRARELDPMRASTRNTLGDIYFDKKEYDKAEDEYKTAIKLDPSGYAPYYSIGLIKKLQGREDESGRWLKKSQKIKEKHGK